MSAIVRKVLSKIAERLPARDIRHPTGDPDGRPYLRRYHVGTAFGIRFYLHHFVDSDPDGLHNHPFLYSCSFILAGHYFEERRFCLESNAKKHSWFNFIGNDDLHRVVISDPLRATYNIGYGTEAFKDAWRYGVWTLFCHTEKVMPWATLKDKGQLGTIYVEEEPEHPVTKGHSDWWKTAPKGKELFGTD